MVFGNSDVENAWNTPLLDGSNDMDKKEEASNISPWTVDSTQDFSVDLSILSEGFNLLLETANSECEKDPELHKKQMEKVLEEQSTLGSDIIDLPSFVCDTFAA